MTAATTGFAKNFIHRDSTMTRIHSRGPRVPSVRLGSARSARVTGAEYTIGSGTAITSSMCSTMWPLKVTIP